MVAETNMNRQEFNEISISREYAYQVGQLLKSKLGVMLVKANNYFPEGVVSEGLEYTINVDVTEVSTSTTTNYDISYVAESTDGVKEVVGQLGNYIDENLSEGVFYKGYLDSASESDMYMTITPKEGYYLEVNSTTNLSSDSQQVWAESDIPACYMAYGKIPESTLPRMVITPLPSSTLVVRMEEGTEIVDGVEREFTSSYINYAINLTCEAGSTEEVMRSGVSSQNVLNTFRKMMTNEIIKKNLQNSINSVCYPLSTITPLPKSSYTQWMDSASTVSTFSCIDVYYPENEAGWIDTVIVTPDYQGGTASEESYDGFDKSRSTQVTTLLKDADLSNAYEGIDKITSVVSEVSKEDIDLTNSYDGINKLSSISSEVVQEVVDLEGVYDGIDKTKTFSGDVAKDISDYEESYTGYDLLKPVQVNIQQIDTKPIFEESTGGGSVDPEPDPDPVLGLSGGIQIGDIIIHSEEYWEDHLGNIIYTLLPQDGSTFDQAQYPELYSILGTDVLEDLDNPEGSEVGYRRVSDYGVEVDETETTEPVEDGCVVPVPSDPDVAIYGWTNINSYFLDPEITGDNSETVDYADDFADAQVYTDPITGDKDLKMTLEILNASDNTSNDTYSTIKVGYKSDYYSTFEGFGFYHDGSVLITNSGVEVDNTLVPMPSLSTGDYLHIYFNVTDGTAEFFLNDISYGKSSYRDYIDQATNDSVSQPSLGIVCGGADYSALKATLYTNICTD